jgi:ParB-like chromosome segregation protein Spo0J
VVATSRALEHVSQALTHGTSVAKQRPRAGVVAQIPIEQIVAPEQPLRSGPDPHLAGLVENLRVNGLLHPVGLSVLADGRLQLVYGQRRLNAARILGWTSIAATLHMELTAEDALVASLSENLARRDLSAHERANALRVLAAVHVPGRQLGGASSGGHAAITPPARQANSANDLSRRLGIDVSSVVRLSALGRNELLLQLVESGQVGLTAASHLARLPSGLQSDALEQVRSQHLSANKTHHLVNRLLRERHSPEPIAGGEKPEPTPAGATLHRLRGALGVLASIDRIASDQERQVLEQLANHVERLRQTLPAGLLRAYA